MGVSVKVSQHEAIRRRLGRTQGDLARIPEVGVTRSYISQVEAGKLPASKRYRKAVARVLGVPETLLFDESGWAR